MSEIIMDHRPYHNQEKRIIEAGDFGDIPKQVKFSVHRMKALDSDAIIELRRPPPQYVNTWVKLDYEDPKHYYLVPLLFDPEGHPYIMVPAKKSKIEVKVLIRGKEVEELLEQLEAATDFCDYCGGPIKAEVHYITGAMTSFLMYEEGETVADLVECKFCEKPNIRWDKGFLESHPVLGELATR